MNEQGKMSVHEILMIVVVVLVICPVFEPATMKVVWDIFVDAMFLISIGFGSILIVFGWRVEVAEEIFRSVRANYRRKDERG